MSAFDEYLMYHLSDLNKHFEDPNERAAHLMEMLAVHEGKMSQALFELWTAGIKIPTIVMRNSLAFYVGLGFLELEEDFFQNYQIGHNQWYTGGLMEASIQGETFHQIDRDIDSLRESLGV